MATSVLQPGHHQRLTGAQKRELLPGLLEHEGQFAGHTGGERAVRQIAQTLVYRSTQKKQGMWETVLLPMYMCTQICRERCTGQPCCGR